MNLKLIGYNDWYVCKIIVEEGLLLTIFLPFLTKITWLAFIPVGMNLIMLLLINHHLKSLEREMENKEQ